MSAVRTAFASTQVVATSGGGGGTGVPVGTITDCSLPAVPAGFLVCDGSLVSRALYPALFAAIGTTYGAGDGSTTFGLPYKSVEIGYIGPTTAAAIAAGSKMTVLNDNRILAISGTNTFLGTLNADSTITWVTSTSYPLNITFGSLHTLSDGRVLYTAGYNGSAVVANTYFGTISGNTITWVAGTALPAVRNLFASMLLPDGRILIVAGGSTSFGTNQTTTYFGTISGNTITWVTGTVYPISVRELSGCVLIDGSVLVTGGYTTVAVTTCYRGVISGTTITWTAVGALPEIKSGHGTLVLPNKDIITVAGNRGGTNYTDNIAIGHNSSGRVQWLTNQVPYNVIKAYYGSCIVGNRILIAQDSVVTLISLIYPIIKT